MKPVKQTKLFTGPGTCGNCLTACVSSLLEIPIDEIPNFVEEFSDWQTALNDFLKPYNMVYIEVPFDPSLDCQTLGYHLNCGLSPRSDTLPHSCIGYNHEFKFDPHPDNSGLIKIERVGLFVVKNPCLQVRYGPLRPEPPF